MAYLFTLYNNSQTHVPPLTRGTLRGLPQHPLESKKNEPTGEAHKLESEFSNLLSFRSLLIETHQIGTRNDTCNVSVPYGHHRGIAGHQ